MRHKRTSLTPLTEEERQFASENHCMIEEFLKYNRLSRSEWYDVVVFRYLLTVQNWFRRPELHRYPFVSLARRNMGSAVHNERLKQRERRMQTVSLDSIIAGTEGLSLMDTITEENLNFVIYVEGEDMNINYNVNVPERDRRRIGQKSDEIIAMESFLKTKNLKNMQISYDTAEEAKKKLPTLQTYRRKNGLKEAIEVFRIETSIYVVRV